METIQQKNRNGQKRGFSSTVLSVKSCLGIQGLSTQKRKDTTALPFAMQKTEKKTGNQRNRRRGEGALVPTKHTENGLRKTLKGWRISRLVGTQENRAQRVRTHWKSGIPLRRHTRIGVRTVINKKNSRKTTLFLYRAAEQITSQTSSHFAARAIVGNGNLNIYSNPELLSV